MTISENLEYIAVNAVIVAIIFILGVITARIASIYARRTLSDKIPANELSLILKVINFGIVTIFILIALPFIGIDPTGLIAAGGFAGLVVGFASRSVVANLVSGIFLIVERPIKIGDVAGFIEDIRILYNCYKNI